MKKKFRPEDWWQEMPGRAGHDEEMPDQVGHDGRNGGDGKMDDVEVLTQRVEARGLDITGDYQRWLNIGFALVEGLGENGRDFFHRLSRFYPGYSEAEADRQYDKCLRAHGTGIRLATLFQYAKEEGIVVRSRTASGGLAEVAEKEMPDQVGHDETPDQAGGDGRRMPTFSQELRGKLPEMVEAIARNGNSEQDADVLILGTIVTLSSCLPHVYGIYGDRPVFPNLFLFVTAPASAGKGRLTLCRRLVQPIQDQFRNLFNQDLEKYRKERAAYEKKRKQDPSAKAPREPVWKMHIIPANSSATMFYQILAGNGGRGLMFETEGDTLANIFASDYGNYSDGFRKAFHHEPISYMRRKDHEYVELMQPKLSTVLSGTPRQIAALIPDAENGLFSRFLFYYVDFQLTWLNVFSGQGDALDETFDAISHQVLALYQRLLQSPDIRFSFTSAQKRVFNTFFSRAQRQYWKRLGDSIIASVRRMGLITFRIAMVLSILRLAGKNELPELVYCSDEDFTSSMTIARVALSHTVRVYRELSSNELAHPAAEGAGRKQELLRLLPDEFDTAMAQEFAQRLSIPRRSAERYLAEWTKAGVLEKVAFGRYQKRIEMPGRAGHDGETPEQVGGDDDFNW